MSVSRCLASLTALLALLALGGGAGCTEDTSSLDGGTGDAALDGTTPDPGAPAAPEVPMLPSFGPCPDGWRPVATGEGFEVCEPYPEAGRTTCGRDEAFFPGTRSCAPIGTPCPAGDFPVDLPADGPVVYVLAGAAGGTGTEGSPYGTIAEATAVASAGSTIALGKGTYREAVTVPAGVTLHGACVAETLVTFDAQTYFVGVIEAGGADVTIRNLRVGDAGRPGITVVGAGRSATIEDVVVHDCFVAGISIEMGASATVARVVTRDHRAVEVLSSGGRGLAVETGAEAVVRHLHAEGCKDYAVLTHDAELTLEDSTIVDTSPATATAPLGVGIMVSGGGQMTGRRVVVEEATGVSAIAQNASSSATFEHLVLRRPRTGGRFGEARGMEANDHAEVECSRCLVEDMLEIAIGAGSGAAMSLRDTMIRRVGPRPADDRSGRAFSVQDGASLLVDRVVAVDLVENGGVVDGLGTTFRGTDLIIRRVESDAHVNAYGRGFTLQNASTTELQRVEIGNLREAGLVLGDDATAILRDFHLHDVAPRGVDQHHGRGMTIQLRSTLTLERARIERVLDVGIAAIGVGVAVNATDVVVNDVGAQQCDDLFCTAEPGGHGIGSYQGALVTATRFGVSAVDLCGFQIADGATVSLADGEVREAVIGVCLQSDAQDVEGLQRGVHYVDNGANLEATMLPVPSALASVD